MTPEPQSQTPIQMDQDAPVVRLDNGLLKLAIRPTLGGKITELRDKDGKQWIWENPNIPLKTTSPGASYDDNWAGGWEELFPNDAQESFGGKDLFDHGEWWNAQWDYSNIADGRGCELKFTTRTLKTECIKKIELSPTKPEVWIRYRITNLEENKIRFLFKQHLAVAVTPHHQIELPGGTAEPVDLNFSTRVADHTPFSWPHGRGKNGSSVDLSRLPSANDKQKEFLYVSELPEGWCGVRDTQTQKSLRLHFDRKVFPHTWLFMTFGGWRDLYTVVLEPCTNKPKGLNEAVAADQCARLEPGETLETDVRAEIIQESS